MAIYLSVCITQNITMRFIQEEDIRKIASMGFDHVRLAIDYEVLEDEYGRTREEGFVPLGLFTTSRLSSS
ncbi:hypothetical protein OBE_00957 [human gut metagenome]|uniref:Uncharacterized protein n=1 Tax=human gut metagenome TaxID=408170 RepID=K1U1T5_9ZZZZ